MGLRRENVRVAVIEVGHHVVAYFPFERLRFGIGRALGYGVSDVQGVVHAPSFEWDGRELLQACGLVAWEFDHLVGSQVQCFAPDHVVHKAVPIVDLRAGWDAWAKGTKKGHRRLRQILQRHRKLEREHGPCSFEFKSGDPSDLSQLINWKSAQYRRTGRFDRFAQRWFADVVREMFLTPTVDFAAQLSILRVHDRPVAASLDLRANKIMASWLSAYDRHYAPYGVGLQQILYFLQEAAADGVDFVDFGAGEEGYKSAFCEYGGFVAEGSVSRATPLAVARRLQTAPKRLVTGFVLSHPTVRKAAREALNHVGRLRTSLRL